MAEILQNHDAGQTGATYFAPPGRLTAHELEAALQQIANSPLVDTIMELLGEWICVISQTRQVLAINHAFLAAVGVEDPDALLGLRVFQRYFSTKSGDGRGLGTHMMKLVGETLLKGTVSFSSSAEDGTTFRIRLPRAIAHTGPDEGIRTAGVGLSPSRGRREPVKPR